MGEISRFLAVARTVKHFGVSENLASQMLREEFPPQYMSPTHPNDIFADDMSLYAGGSSHGYVHDAVDEEELATWLAGGTAPGKAITNKKATQRSFDKDDAPLLEEMQKRIIAGESRSPWNAALAVVDRAKGGGTTESRQRRLQRSYVKKYGVT